MVDWNKAFEFTWRILVFIVAIAIIVIVSTNWTRWEGGEGWQRTNDAYLQSDLTPISAKVTGYIRELPIRDYERVRRVLVPPVSNLCRFSPASPLQLRERRPLARTPAPRKRQVYARRGCPVVEPPAGQVSLIRDLWGRR